MVQAVSLALGLFATWLLWSGHTDFFLVGLGLLSVALVIYVANRMTIMDREGVPVHLTRNIFTYWGWLLVEIVKSNITVARIVLSPGLPISPTVVRIKGEPESDLSRVILANSIILTPGTLTLDLKDGIFTVHALTEDGARDIEAGAMNRRVGALEGKTQPENKG